MYDLFLLKSRYVYLRSLFSDICANQQVDDLITNKIQLEKD